MGRLFHLGAAVAKARARELLERFGVRDVGVRRSTLNDVFFALTGHPAEEDRDAGGDGDTDRSAGAERADGEATIR